MRVYTYRLPDVVGTNGFSATFPYTFVIVCFKCTLVATFCHVLSHYVMFDPANPAHPQSTNWMLTIVILIITIIIITTTTTIIVLIIIVIITTTPIHHFRPPRATPWQGRSPAGPYCTKIY